MEKLIVSNKKARFDYEIFDTWEAGLVLKGSEVKSLRNSQITLKDSYISFIKDEAYLQNAHISEYKKSSYNNHEPERLRKLLLHKKELEKISEAITEKGLTCVPLKMYFKRGRVKVLIGVGRGKSFSDKRASVKKREANREIQRGLRRDRG